MLKRKATYHFIEFVRPDGFWPHPYTVEQAFGVLGWMVRTAQEQDAADPRSRPWAGQAVKALLSCKPTCTGFTMMEPVVSLADLERRFHHALLSGHVGAKVEAWRRRHKIWVGGSAVASFRYYPLLDARQGGKPMCHADLKRRLDALLQATGKLKAQLNPVHSRAREVYGVWARYGGFPDGWRFVLRYGFDCSVWSHMLAEQKQGEPFLDTFLRAEATLAELRGEKPCA